MNVAIMLISFLALVALLDSVLLWTHGLAYMHWVPGSLGQILGFFFAPVAWFIAFLGTIVLPSATCWARAWRSTKSSPTSRWARKEPCLHRAPSPSPPLRCAASPTLAPSECNRRHRRTVPSAATT